MNKEKHTKNPLKVTQKERERTLEHVFPNIAEALEGLTSILYNRTSRGTEIPEKGIKKKSKQTIHVFFAEKLSKQFTTNV